MIKNCLVCKIGFTSYPFRKKNIYCSQRCWGLEQQRSKKVSNETRKKISISCSGKKNHNWKGNNAGYFAKHIYMKKHFGQPDTCEYCGTSGLKGHNIAWANKSGEYKREKIDWFRLCASCHFIYDRNKRMRELMLDFIEK